MIALLLMLMLSAGRQGQPPRDPVRPADISMGSISGRVVAPDGKTALRRAVVRLSSPALPRRLTTRADQQGRYTFKDLPAGRYTVVAAKPGHLTLEYGQRRPFEPGRRIELRSAEKLADVNIVLPQSASISGLVVDETGEPLYQMWVVPARMGFRNGRRELVGAGGATVTNDIGEFRLSGLAPGDFYLIARERDARVRDGSDESIGFGTTLYPNASTLSAAQPITVSLGQQITGVTFSVVSGRTSVVSGQVVDVSGQPARVSNVTITTGLEMAGFGDVIGGASVDEAGRFRVAGLRPGGYVFSASSGEVRGEARVDTQGEDLRDLTIVIGTGGTLTGRVIFPAGAVAGRSGLIGLCSAPVGTTTCLTSGVRIAPDGSFTWSGFQGDRLIRAMSLPAGWWLKAVKQADRDVTDVPLTVNHGDRISDVQVTLDDKPTEISGSVHGATAGAVGDYTVIVFSADEARWQLPSRFIESARPDHHGVFRVVGLPPGDYLAVALDWLENGQWFDVQTLRRLRDVATKVTLDAGQKATVELKLSELPSVNIPQPVP